MYVFVSLLSSLVTLIPLSENMPSGTAIKPGDVVRAMNGKTIEVMCGCVCVVGTVIVLLV